MSPVVKSSEKNMWGDLKLSTAYLILANGSVFEGQTFGYEAEITGELVFCTGMTGYIETLTDPSYFGQIVLQTFPLSGNYGVIPSDCESADIHASAYIVREWCQEPSNFRSEGELDTFLRQKQIPGLYGIDTRAITKIIRENGTMNARISKSRTLSQNEKRALAEYKVSGAVSSVTNSEPYGAKSDEGRFRVGILNLGVTNSLISALTELGCDVAVLPATATADKLTALELDGLVISPGPGDPAENTDIIATLKALAEAEIPTFGIGLGHQLLALARGAVTEKLPLGHRGTNQPVKDMATGRLFATSQNHGYVVTNDSIPPDAQVSYVNCNDGSCEGLNYKSEPVFSVQFVPSADTGLLRRFITLMERMGQ